MKTIFKDDQVVDILLSRPLHGMGTMGTWFNQFYDAQDAMPRVDMKKTGGSLISRSLVQAMERLLKGDKVV